MLAMASGTRNFHPKPINWSYRKRGVVPRTQMYRKTKKKTFNTNQKTGSSACMTIQCGVGSRLPKGLDQPPKKSNVATQPTVIILAYSAMKNMANFMELYSVW